MTTNHSLRCGRSSNTWRKQELVRVGNSYAEEAAFPLRVGINYLKPDQAPGQGGQGGEAPVAKPEEVIIPSLTPPPAPFTQVLVALLYIMPITFISIFFTSSFMDEKINRRLTILLSAPVTPFQIILGKMLPYAIFALVTTALIAVLTKGNVLLALAIFAPTTLFIFAIYLMVPLFYRTFKDTTFIAMLVTTLTTAYLVFPAMFTNVNDLAYISPLTLAVKMYRNEPFGWREYLFPSLPMAAIFGFAMFAGTRMLNEEFLMGYKPITRKISRCHLPDDGSYQAVPVCAAVEPVGDPGRVHDPDGFSCVCDQPACWLDPRLYADRFRFDRGGGQVDWDRGAGGAWRGEICARHPWVVISLGAGIFDRRETPAFDFDQHGVAGSGFRRVVRRGLVPVHTAYCPFCFHYHHDLVDEQK